MKWIYGFIASSLFAVFVVVPTVSNHFVSEGMTKLRAAEAELHEVLPKFIADLKQVEAHPPFPDWSRERNAEPFISQYVSWSGKDFEPLQTPSHKALRELFAKYPKAMNEDGQMRAFAADPLLARVDTSWMEKLKDYDHWRWSANAKILGKIARAKETNSIGRIGIYATLPLPDYIELQHFALAHFMKSKKPAEGLAVFRKTAELAHTSNTLIGAMVAAGMLKAEMRLVAYAGAYTWPLVPAEDVERYRRVAWTWAAYTTAVWMNDFPKELEAYMKPQLGLCGGAGENLAGIASISDYVEPRFPFESDFSAELERARNLQGKTREICGQSDFAPFGARTPASANPLIQRDAGGLFTLVSGAQTPATFFNPARLPFVRRAVGVMLMTIAMPNFLRFYREEAH